MGGATVTAGPHRVDLAPQPPIALGNLAVFRDQYRVTVAGRRVNLTYREFEFLVLLATNAGRVVRYGDVGEALWGRRGADLRRRMSVLVCRLRDKLAGMEPYRIETVRQVGYRLADPSPVPAAGRAETNIATRDKQRRRRG
jgi:DNA-binding response OmpR family regulator